MLEMMFWCFSDLFSPHETPNNNYSQFLLTFFLLVLYLPALHTLTLKVSRTSIVFEKKKRKCTPTLPHSIPPHPFILFSGKQPNLAAGMTHIFGGKTTSAKDLETATQIRL